MKRAFFLTALCCSILLALPVWSAEQALNTADYAYGEVVQSSNDQLVISEYDYEMDEELQVTYTINSQTAFTNVADAVKLAKGDAVEIYYKESNGKRVADMVIKDDMPNPVDDQAPPVEADGLDNRTK